MVRNLRSRIGCAAVALLVCGVAAPARADMGVPMLAYVWPLSWVLLLPIILTEAVIAWRFLHVPFWTGLKIAGWSNLLSTVVGIPVTWVLLLILEIVVGGALGWALNWAGATTLSRVIATVLTAPWLLPQYPERSSEFLIAGLLLCLPLFLMSVWCEGTFARRFLASAERTQAVAWAWRANSVSYVFVVGALVVFLLQSLAFERKHPAKPWPPVKARHVSR